MHHPHRSLRVNFDNWTLVGVSNAILSENQYVMMKKYCKPRDLEIFISPHQKQFSVFSEASVVSHGRMRHSDAPHGSFI